MSMLGNAWRNRHAYDAADPIGHLRCKRHVNRTGWTADAAANAQTVNPNGVYNDRRFRQRHVADARQGRIAGRTGIVSSRSVRGLFGHNGHAARAILVRRVNAINV